MGVVRTLVGRTGVRRTSLLLLAVATLVVIGAAGCRDDEPLLSREIADERIDACARDLAAGRRDACMQFQSNSSRYRSFRKFMLEDPPTDTDGRRFVQDFGSALLRRRFQGERTDDSGGLYYEYEIAVPRPGETPLELPIFFIMTEPEVGIAAP